MDRLFIESVTKQYGDTTAVDGISLTVEGGEVLGVVGPSGCGKTTLLRTVAGFETPEGGRVRFNDEDVTHVPPERRNTGLVFQTYALFENMTVLENITFGPKMHGISKEERRERARELLDLLDIVNLEGRDPTTLSGGQQQRVGLARALAIRPRVLLLDEPMTGLDAKLKTELRREIGALLDDLDVTTLYVTHDQEEAMAMADRIAVMNAGTLQQVGTPEELYETPANAFVADFLGTSNLLPATANGRRLDLGFTEIDLNGQSASGEVTVVARPEAFSIDGPITATVTRRSYFGRHVRVSAVLPTGQEIILDLDGTAPNVGDELELSLNVDRVHLIERKSPTRYR
jgi:putative spermidine/putrescine transport system ATP-binding protein